MEYILICVLSVWSATLTWIVFRQSDKLEILRSAQQWQIDGWARGWQEAIDELREGDKALHNDLSVVLTRVHDLERELPADAQWRDTPVIRGGGPRPEVRNIERNEP